MWAFILEWIRWEIRLVMLCVVAVGLAVLYAQFDEEFADRLSWTSRAYIYPNAITLSCGISGPCDRLLWQADRAEDKSAEALAIQTPEGLLTADDLQNPERLMALGWAAEQSSLRVDVRDATALQARGIALPASFEEPDVLVLGRGRADDPAQPYLRARFRNGALEEVVIRGAGAMAVTRAGRAYAFPIARTRVEAAWGPPSQLVRRNAING